MSSLSLLVLEVIELWTTSTTFEAALASGPPLLGSIEQRSSADAYPFT